MQKVTGGQVFDEDEGHFSTHLGGAEKILHNLHSSQPSHSISRFLINWFLYYDILGRFTQSSHTGHDDSGVMSLLGVMESDSSVVSPLPSP